MDELITTVRFRWLVWRVRRGRQLAQWLAARIPASWRYWVLLDALSKLMIDLPDATPGQIRAMDLIEWHEPLMPVFRVARRGEKT